MDNNEGKLVLYQLVQEIHEASVDLGMARQRHIDAAADERSAYEDVAEIGKKLSEVIGPLNPAEMN